jgi:hypothetical protein
MISGKSGLNPIHAHYRLALVPGHAFEGAAFGAWHIECSQPATSELIDGIEADGHCGLSEPDLGEGARSTEMQRHWCGRSNAFNRWRSGRMSSPRSDRIFKM